MQTLDHTGQILDLVAHIERLAEQCELDREVAWAHPEPLESDLLDWNEEG